MGSNVSNNNSRIAKNTMYLYIRMFFILLINLYTTRVLLDALGVKDYGIYNVVGGVVAFLAFLRSAMANGFQRFYNISLGKKDNRGFLEMFSVSISVQAIISIVFMIMAESVGLWFVNTQLTIPTERMMAANIVYQSSIVVFLLTMFTSPYNAVIIAYEKMGIFAIVSIASVLLKLLIAYLAAFGPDRLIFYSVLTLVVHAILMVSYIVFALKQNREISIRPSTNFKQIKEMLAFSGWNLFGSVAHAAKSHGLNIVLNMFFDPVVNAARGVAYQVNSGVTSLYHNFQTAARPQVIKYYAQNNLKEMLKLSNRVSKFSFLLLWICDLPFLFTADYYLSLWLGNEMPKYAPIFTNIVLLTTALECFSTPISNLVHATGRMRNFQVVTSSVIMLIIPIAYLVLYLGGNPESALYCSLAMAPIVQATRLIMVKKILPFSIKMYMKDVVMPCFYVSVVSTLISIMVNQLFSLHPVLLSAIIFVIACGISLFCGCTTTERNAFMNKIRLISSRFL